MTVNDFNGDGRLDLAFAAEIDFDVKTSAAIEDSKCVWVLQNTTAGWVVQTEGLPDRLISDVIHSKDMDQDGRPDLIVASNSSGERRLIYLNRETRAGSTRYSTESSARPTTTTSNRWATRSLRPSSSST